MARTFTTTGNKLTLNETFNVGNAGSIVVTLKPTWNGTDGQTHYFWRYLNSTTGQTLEFYKTLIGADDYCWCGFQLSTPTYNAVSDYRGLLITQNGLSAHSNLFIAGETVQWVCSWHNTNWAFDDPRTSRPAGYVVTYRNGPRVIGLIGRPCANIPFTVPTFDSLTIGDGAGGDISEFARFDYPLSDQQRFNMNLTGIEGVTPPPVHYVKISGDVSPEPATIGSDLIVVGAPPKAAHPVYRSLPAPMQAAKPPSTARIHTAHPLAAGLIMAFPFIEGAGTPREHVANAGPTYVQGVGVSGSELPPNYLWEPDISFHIEAAALQYPTTAFDGLQKFTICAGITIDLYEFGSSYPTGTSSLAGLFVKQYKSMSNAGDAAQSVFMIVYQHGDEIDTTSGGRDEFWCCTGLATGPGDPEGFPDLAGMDVFYMYRFSAMPWDLQFIQVLFMFDATAPPLERWTCRYNGTIQHHADVYLDAPEPLPITPAPVVLGASQSYPYQLNGNHPGRFQYLYVWNDAKPDVWRTLLDDPFAFFRPANIQGISGTPMRESKIVSGLSTGLMKSWGGVA